MQLLLYLMTMLFVPVVLAAAQLSLDFRDSTSLPVQLPLHIGLDLHLVLELVNDAGVGLHNLVALSSHF